MLQVKTFPLLTHFLEQQSTKAKTYQMLYLKKRQLPLPDILYYHDGLLLRASRLVIPSPLQGDILIRIHSGHQGLTKCRERVRQCVWWPGMSKDLEKVIMQCQVCCQHRQQHTEPLMPTPFPDYPWQKVASDLFDWHKNVVVNYYSRFIEIAKLSSTTSTDVVTHLRSIFARHSIPEVFISDSGPQYSSSLFAKFSREYKFNHITSSPRYLQAHGEAESAVKTIKAMQ